MDFAQVQLTPSPRPALDDKSGRPVTPPRPAVPIEIVLPGGVMLRVDAEVHAAALGRVLAALDRQ
jgi:hypothetical protein